MSKTSRPQVSILSINRFKARQGNYSGLLVLAALVFVELGLAIDAYLMRSDASLWPLLRAASGLLFLVLIASRKPVV